MVNKVADLKILEANLSAYQRKLNYNTIYLFRIILNFIQFRRLLYERI